MWSCVLLVAIHLDIQLVFTLCRCRSYSSPILLLGFLFIMINLVLIYWSIIWLCTISFLLANILLLSWWLTWLASLILLYSTWFSVVFHFWMCPSFLTSYHCWSIYFSSGFIRNITIFIVETIAHPFFILLVTLAQRQSPLPTMSALRSHYWLTLASFANGYRRLRLRLS